MDIFELDPSIEITDENYWYENELQLAAELGKTLLERNKELENQLSLAHQLNHDRVNEITFYRQQVESLRELNQSKMRIYEEIDKNSQETEKINQKLQREMRVDKEKIKRLHDTLEAAENRCEDLHDELENLRKLKSSKKDKLKVKTRASSFPSLHNFGIDLDGFKKNNRDVEILHLHETVRNIKSRLTVDQHKCDELESEMFSLIQENKQLETKVEELQDSSNKLKVIEAEFKDLELRNIRAEKSKICEKCHECLEKNEKERCFPMLDVEHDINEIRHGQVLKMDNGGSVFGSKESLFIAGIDTHDLEVHFDMSLLTELDQQYHRLVQKYESLIEAKRRSLHLPIGSPTKVSQEVQTLKPLDSDVEYKKIFEEIFTTLRRSISYDDISTKGISRGPSKQDMSEILE